MKRLALSVALLLLVGTAAFTQPMFGIKGGLSTSTFWDDGVDPFEDGLAPTEESLLNYFTGGIFARYEIIPEFIAFQPELLYLRSGKKWEVNGAELDLYNDYLSVPLLVKLLIPLDLPMTPSIYAGPVVSFRLRSRAEGVGDVPAGTDIGFLTGLNEDIGDETRAVDVGLATGINFDIEAGPGTVLLDFRANFGFVEPFDVPNGEDIRNLSFQFMLGYGLRF